MTAIRKRFLRSDGGEPKTARWASPKKVRENRRTGGSSRHLVASPYTESACRIYCVSRPSASESDSATESGRAHRTTVPPSSEGSMVRVAPMRSARPTGFRERRGGCRTRWHHPGLCDRSCRPRILDPHDARDAHAGRQYGQILRCCRRPRPIAAGPARSGYPHHPVARRTALV